MLVTSLTAGGGTDECNYDTISVYKAVMTMRKKQHTE
jgi:hypothetical protein